MRFLHTADIHLGATPDRNLPWGAERKAAIWNTFTKIIDTAGKEKVDLLLIAGDFFHRQPLQRELAEVSYLFEQIPETRIVIIAGNHDYIRNDSPYLTWNWPHNVVFLTEEAMSEVTFPEIGTTVHGFSYHHPEITEALLDDLSAPKDGNYQILLAHGGDKTHIPIRIDKLAEAGFDYAALGHIHQPSLYSKAALAFSGSPEPMDRSDMGRRGFILGECSQDGCEFHFVPLSEKEYRPVALTVNPTSTTAQVIDLLKKNLDKNPRYIYRITLKGQRDPDIEFDLDRIRSCAAIVDVTDESEPSYDLDRLMEEHAHDIVSHLIRELSGPGSGEVEKKALTYSLRALLSQDAN